MPFCRLRLLPHRRPGGAGGTAGEASCGTAVLPMQCRHMQYCQVALAARQLPSACDPWDTAQATTNQPPNHPTPPILPNHPQHHNQMACYIACAIAYFWLLSRAFDDHARVSGCPFLRGDGAQQRRWCCFRAASGAAVAAAGILFVCRPQLLCMCRTPTPTHSPTHLSITRPSPAAALLTLPPEQHVGPRHGEPAAGLRWG